MKKWIRVLLIIMLVVVVGLVASRWGWLDDKDYRLGVVGKNGVGLVSVSYQRKMVNLLVIPDKAKVWIPYGPGWYEVDKIDKLFELSDLQKSKEMMFVYNWGFVPDKIISLEKVEDWENVKYWWRQWGIFNWLRYKVGQGEWWYKAETLKGKVEAKNEDMVDTLLRDFADASSIDEDVKLSIYNNGGGNGLAGFMANLIDWSGVSVVGVENGEDEKEKGCRLLFAKESEKKRSIYLLKKMFPDCKNEVSDKVGGDQVEAYFDESFSQMINYESYKTINN